VKGNVRCHLWLGHSHSYSSLSRQHVKNVNVNVGENYSRRQSICRTIYHGITLRGFCQLRWYQIRIPRERKRGGKMTTRLIHSNHYVLRNNPPTRPFNIVFLGGLIFKAISPQYSSALLDRESSIFLCAPRWEDWYFSHN
jgi:hypothetical protein